MEENEFLQRVEEDLYVKPLELLPKLEEAAEENLHKEDFNVKFFTKLLSIYRVINNLSNSLELSSKFK
jgi:hypothetical protein